MPLYIGEAARSTADYVNKTPLGYGTGNLLLLAGLIVLALLLIMHFAGGVKFRWDRDIRIGVYSYVITLILLYLHDVRKRPKRDDLAAELCVSEPSSVSVPIQPVSAPAQVAPVATSVATYQPVPQPVQQPVQQPVPYPTQTFQPPVQQPMQQPMQQPSMQQPTYGFT